MMGFAFQIYATFVAGNSEMKEDYQCLAKSVLENQSNWSSEQKYLIPALGTFLTTMICKHTDFVQQNYTDSLKNIVQHLMKPDIRMEQVALSISSTLFERLSGNYDHGFLN